MTSSTSSTDSKIASTNRLKMLAGISITIAVVAVMFAYGAIRSARSQRHEILLVDPGGRPRVRIAALGEGGAIELLDERGRARIAVQQAGDDSSISMGRREEHEVPFEAGFFTNGNRTFLEMRDSATDTRAYLGVTGDGRLDLEVIENGATLSTSSIDAFLLLSNKLNLKEYARYVLVELTKPWTRVGFFVPKNPSSGSVDRAPFMLYGNEVAVPE